MDDSSVLVSEATALPSFLSYSSYHFLNASSVSES
jgi:hypothetical protein